MDFRVKRSSVRFSVRVSALLVLDGKIYLVKAPQGHYYTLGGAIAVGERTDKAVKREIFEELGIDLEVGPLAFIVENQFDLDNEHFHNIEFHYLVYPLGSPANEILEGGMVRRCEWLAIDDLVDKPVKPDFLRTALKNWNGQLQHIKEFGDERK